MNGHRRLILCGELQYHYQIISTFGARLGGRALCSCSFLTPFCVRRLSEHAMCIFAASMFFEPTIEASTIWAAKLGRE